MPLTSRTRGVSPNTGGYTGTGSAQAPRKMSDGYGIAAPGPVGGGSGGGGGVRGTSAGHSVGPGAQSGYYTSRQGEQIKIGQHAPEAPDAPEGPPPVPGGGAMAAMSNPALEGLASAFTDPGPGFRPDVSIDGAQPGLGMRVQHQPLDILRQIVAQRGRAY